MVVVGGTVVVVVVGGTVVVVVVGGTVVVVVVGGTGGLVGGFHGFPGVRGG